MINDRDLRFQLVQRKFFFPPPLPIKSRLLICGGSNKYRRLLSLFRERFIHAERHVNWHVQGAKQHVASPTHQLPRLIYRASFISQDPSFLSSGGDSRVQRASPRAFISILLSVSPLLPSDRWNYPPAANYPRCSDA